jgi:hypothetical protein
MEDYNEDFMLEFCLITWSDDVARMIPFAHFKVQKIHCKWEIVVPYSLSYKMHKGFASSNECLLLGKLWCIYLA